MNDRTGGRSGSTASSGSSATGLSDGNATQLLDKWAACMRSHDDPGQAHPRRQQGDTRGHLALGAGRVARVLRRVRL